MKYLSLDIETTGVDEQICQILQVSCIVEDTNLKLPFDELPKFNVYFKHKTYTFDSATPVSMHHHLIKEVEKYGVNLSVFLIPPIDIIHNHTKTRRNPFAEFIQDNFGEESVTLAGKNVISFDVRFLKHNKLLSGIRFKHRAIDPSILYIDWKNDKSLPDSQTMFDRAELDTTVAHDAMDDAWQIIRCLRKFY